MNIAPIDLNSRAQQLLNSQEAYRDALRDSAAISRPVLCCCRPRRLSATERARILRAHTEAFIVSLFACAPQTASRVYDHRPSLGALIDPSLIQYRGGVEVVAKIQNFLLENLAIHGTLLAVVNPGLDRYEQGPCVLIPILNELATVVDEIMLALQTNQQRLYGDKLHSRFMVAVGSSFQLHHQTTHLTSNQRSAAVACFIRLKEFGSQLVSYAYKL
jgi:hypothetical protein